MDADNVRNAGVIGAGIMGNGIAHVFALAGIDVVLVDVSAEILEKAVSRIEKNLGRQASKGAIEESAVAEALGEEQHPLDRPTAPPLKGRVCPEVCEEPLRLLLPRREREEIRAAPSRRGTEEASLLVAQSEEEEAQEEGSLSPRRSTR